MFPDSQIRRVGLSPAVLEGDLRRREAVEGRAVRFVSQLPVEAKGERGGAPFRLTRCKVRQRVLGRALHLCFATGSFPSALEAVWPLPAHFLPPSAQVERSLSLLVQLSLHLQLSVVRADQICSLTSLPSRLSSQASRPVQAPLPSASTSRLRLAASLVLGNESSQLSSTITTGLRADQRKLQLTPKLSARRSDWRGWPAS